MKTGLLVCAVLIALRTVAHTQSAADSSIYNRAGYEVGVIRGEVSGGKAFVVFPTKATLDLGYYEVFIPRQALRPRRAGRWVTLLTNEQLAFLSPTDNRYFQPSGG